MKHDEEQQEENRESPVLVRQDGIYQVGCMISVLLRARLVAGLCQRSVDESVFCIHDGGLRVIARLLLHSHRGTVAGCCVTDGKIQRNAQIRLLRDNVIIHEGKIDSLKRFKDDAKEVNTGYECGIGIENYNDIKENDVIECFVMEEIER